MHASNVTTLAVSSMQKDNPPATYPGIGSKRNPKEPLYGFMPRRVTADQVRSVLVRECPTRCDWKTDTTAGWGYQPIQQTTALCTIQENPSSQEKASCLRPDGRVLRNGECFAFDLRSGRGGQNLLQNPSRKLAMKLISWKVHKKSGNRHGRRNRVRKDYTVRYASVHAPSRANTSSQNTSVRMLLRPTPYQRKTRGLYATPKSGSYVCGQACCR